MFTILTGITEETNEAKIIFISLGSFCKDYPTFKVMH